MRTSPSSAELEPRSVMWTVESTRALLPSTLLTARISTLIICSRSTAIASSATTPACTEVWAVNVNAQMSRTPSPCAPRIFDPSLASARGILVRCATPGTSGADLFFYIFFARFSAERMQRPSIRIELTHQSFAQEVVGGTHHGKHCQEGCRDAHLTLHRGQRARERHHEQQ